MKTIPLIIMLVISAFGFSGCKEVVVPKLQTYRYSVHMNGNYKVKNGYVQVPVKDLKQCVVNCDKSNQINKLLNDEIDDYNNEFVKG